jgi:membrane-bound lytic murein transglycosylase F
MKSILHFFAIMGSLLVMASCHHPLPPEPEPEPEVAFPVDTLTIMERIEEREELVAITNNGFLNYRLYDGHPAGFHFELLDDFSEMLGLNLQIMVNDSLEGCLHLLKSGLVDVYAGVFDSLIVDNDFEVFPIATPVETEQTFAWVILKHENDSSFREAIQLWLDDFKGSQMRRAFYGYFSGGRIRRDSAFMVTDHISRYDKSIKAEAEKYGWDWRLLASIIYQESHFKPDLESEKGAFGLMQLMPVTMEKYGIDYESSIEEQLEAGVKVLNHFNRELPETITDSLERIHFILASYNAGMGHVLEARHRAEKHGKNPDVWIDNVEFYTPKQTYFFVREITERYSHYKNLIE